MAKKKIIYKNKTKFNDIVVTEEGTMLTLWSPSTIRQTAIDSQNPVWPQLEYARNVLLGLALCPKPASILVLGLGGGSIPMMLADINTKATIDVVEIDDVIAMVAERYFHFITTPRIKLFIDDASCFIKHSTKIYDMIIIDAYLGNELPPFFSTAPFFEETSQRLSWEGIVIVNLFSRNKIFFKGMREIMASVFHELWYLPGKRSGNTLVFASKIEQPQKKIICNAEALQKDIPFDFPLVKLTKRLHR